MEWQTDNASLDELLVKIKDELRKLGPLIDLDSIRGANAPRPANLPLPAGERRHGTLGLFQQAPEASA
jgi:hypothetical protein